jgi:hypothetical protein
LSGACSDLANHIEKAHKDIEDELISLVEWTIAIEAAGAAASFFSFGAAEIPTQAAEAARIGATASKVAKIISSLISVTSKVTETVAGVFTKIGEVAQRLAAILGARLSKAMTALAERLPKLGGKSAFDRLGVWAEDWSTRGLEIEKQLGGNLPRSFPTIDKFESGVATSIKSVDLAAPTYQNSASLASKLRGYVDSVADFKGASWDGTAIRARDVSQRVLQVAIQPGVESSAQRAVFERLEQYATSKGVKLVISEVP